jgi:hypothetical protein
MIESSGPLYSNASGAARNARLADGLGRLPAQSMIPKRDDRLWEKDHAQIK